MTLPIPVRSVDLADARDDLSGLGEAIEAHIVVRHHGAPLCRVRAPVVGGRVPISAVWDACVASLEDRGDVVFPHVPAGTVTLAPCTVVVCTKDRPDDLRRCLKALAPFAAASVELLVVDNAPSDDRTRAVVREFPATYICQMRQGLNWARHAGVEAAQHGIVMFVDDDVVVEPDWLDQMRRPFRDDSVGGVTGAVEPLELETEGQILAERYAGFYRGFAPRRFDLRLVSPAGAGAAGAGASMAVRRDVALSLALFSNEMDAGTATRSGGDHYALYAIMRAGYAVMFQPRALAWHRHRRTVLEVERALYGYGSGSMCAALRAILVHRDLDPLLVSFRWQIIPAIEAAWRSWRTRGASRPANLVRADWRGIMAGPMNYWRAARTEARLASLPGGETRLAAGTGATIKDHSDAPGDPRSQLMIGGPKAEVTRQPPSAPLVSVVIPTHNRRHTLERTLRALATQTLDVAHYEVIVVADGCTDHTAQFVTAFQPPYQLTFIEQSPGKGAGAARNAGAQRAAAALLLFLDDDMEARPTLLEAHVEGHGRNQDDSTVLLGYFPMPQPSPHHDALTKFARLWWAEGFAARAEPTYRFSFKDFCTGNVSLRRDQFLAVGGFHAGIGARVDGEDYELGYRLIRAGARFRYAPRAASMHHSAMPVAVTLRRGEQEGRGHAVIAQMYPELFGQFDISHMSRLAKTPAFAPLWRACWRWPLLPAIPAAILHVIVRVLVWAECYSLLWTFYRPLRGYHYWRGVRDAIGWTGWERLSRAAVRDTPARQEIEVDVARDWDALEAKIDGWDVDAIRVSYGGAPIGRLAPVAGSEPLTAAQARALIASRFGKALLIARARSESARRT